MKKKEILAMNFNFFLLIYKLLIFFIVLNKNMNLIDLENMNYSNPQISSALKWFLETIFQLVFK